ncbi:MAG: hypothetical protein JSU05_02650 [Bacteroidetes bacterium]|nr:hypothetical protein [Bacteroidota bacterium]
MLKKTHLLVLLSFPILSFCQVGVGTNSVDPSAKLQVESSNKGFLPPRITLTGTNDNSTIANPATGLMIFNTATAGSGSNTVTPGVYYFSGSAWQRLTEVQSSTFISGNLSVHTGGDYLMAGMPANSFELGQITLPPGKWEVALNIVNLCLNSLGATSGYSGCNFYMNYWLQDDETSTSIGYIIPANITDITSDVIMPGGASFMDIQGDNSPRLNAGKFYINNTGTSNKTYYLFAIESTPCGDPFIDGLTPQYNELGNGSFKQNRFYATKIY